MSGSTVCIDVNANSVCDAGEDSTTTDGAGEFTLSSTQKGTLLLVGGDDIGTGLPFTGSLKAPAGSTVITPLTSAVQAMVENGSSAADAEASLKAALGIDATVALTSFDPLKEITGANAANAQIVLEKQAQLQTIVHAAAATVAGAGADKAGGTVGEKDVAGAMDNIFKEISKNFAGATTSVTLTSAQVATATKAAATTLHSTNPAALVAVKATAESAAVNAVATAKTTADAIKNATNSEAVAKFDAAIVQANTTLQDSVESAATAAQVKAAILTSEQLKVITDAQALQEAKIAAAVKAEADAAAALVAAEAKKDADKAAYEAYLAARVAQEKAAAAEAVAKAVAAEAAAKAVQAEAKLAVDQEAATTKAAVDLAAIQVAAQKEAEAAALRIAALVKAEADAKAATNLVAAQAAATAAAEAAAQAIADAEATAKTLADAEVARIAAEKLAAEQAATTAAQAAQAAAEAQALLARKARIELLVTKVNTIDANVSATMTQADAIAAEVSSNMSAIFAIATEYDAAKTKANDANTSAYAAADAYNAAKGQATVVANAKTAILQAKTDVNETVAKTQETTAVAAKIIFDEKIAVAKTKAQAVGSILIEVQAIKTNADAAEAAATAVRIAAFKTAAATALTAIEKSKTDAAASATKARTDANVAAALALSDTNAQSFATAAATAATAAESAAATAAQLATDAKTHKDATDAATIEATVQEQSGFVTIKVTPAANAAATAATEAAKAATALAGAQALMANYAVEGPSAKVTTAINSLNAFNAETDSMTALLAEIKASLGTQNKDEKVLAAMIEIIEIINSTEMNTFISQDSGLPNLDALTGNSEALLEIAQGVSIANGTEIMHETATRLKNASDVIAAAFSDHAKVIAYEDTRITYDDSLVIRAAALSAAGAIDTFASYTYGDISHLRNSTATIDGEAYDYIPFMVDPLALLQQATFFKMSNTSRLAQAGVYVKTAAELIASIDIANVSLEEITVATVADAAAVSAAFNGGGVYVTNVEKQESVNLNKLFSSSDYIDRDDFTIPTTYMGVSAKVIAEYEKLQADNDAWTTYYVAQCKNYDPELAQPVSSNIDYDLAYSDVAKTSITLDVNASIKANNPVQHENTMQYSWVNYSNNCSVETNYDGWDNRFEAKLEPTPKASFDDVFVFDKSDEFTTADVSGKTLYLAGINYNGAYFVKESTFNTNLTATVMEGAIDINASYEIVNGVLHIYNDSGFDITHEKDGKSYLFYNLPSECSTALYATWISDLDKGIANSLIFDNKAQRDSCAAAVTSKL